MSPVFSGGRISDREKEQRGWPLGWLRFVSEMQTLPFADISLIMRHIPGRLLCSGPSRGSVSLLAGGFVRGCDFWLFLLVFTCVYWYTNPMFTYIRERIHPSCFCFSLQKRPLVIHFGIAQKLLLTAMGKKRKRAWQMFQAVRIRHGSRMNICLLFRHN